MIIEFKQEILVISKRVFGSILLLGSFYLPLTALAQAQPYPNRPVKVIVAFTAGGTTDILTRMVSQKLTERVKQSFVVENKPGGGGNIGTEFVAKSVPDGYTLIMDSVGPIAVNQTL